MTVRSFISAVMLVMILSVTCSIVFADENNNKYNLPENIKINGFISEQLGFTNNTELNPERRRDGFFQTASNVDVTYNAAGKLDLKGGADLLDLAYLNYNKNNFVTVSPYTGFDYEILPGLTSRNRISYDYVGFPNAINNTYSGMTLATYLRHFFLPNTYQEAAYEYSWRWWQKQRIYMYGGAFDGVRIDEDKRREDNLYRLRYTFGTYFKRFNLSVSNELSRNYSNYEYEKFYDYFAYKLRPSLTVFFTDKFYVNSTFTYQHFLYKERRLVLTDNFFQARLRQRDRARYTDNYIFTASAYYDLFKNTTLGVTYTYNQYDPKDVYYKYSASTVTSGVYIKF